MRPDRSMIAGWRGDLLALAAGAVLPLAFAPVDLCLLAIVSLGLLFSLWLDATPRLAARRGYFYGLGMFGVGTSWVFVSMYRYGGDGPVIAALLTAIFVLVLACYPALAGWLGARLARSRSRPVALLLVLPAVWVLVEWVRSWLFTGFPWLNIGYSQVENPLSGYAPLAGVYGVGLAAALSAGLLLLALRRGQRKAALAGLLVVWLLGWAAQHIEWTQPDGRALRVSLIQGNVAQDTKWLPENLWPTIDLYAELTRGQWDSDIVVWPETAIPIFLHQAVPFLEQFGAEARAEGTDVILGIPIWDEASGRFYNSLMTVGRDTRFYHKRHLVPFGEFAPFQDLLGPLLNVLDVPLSGFSRGAPQQPPLLAGGAKAGGSICYEVAFGEEIIRSLPEAQLLVNVSNDAWFGASLAPHQHLQMARLRSLETGRWLMRATNTGISALIDPRGEVTAASPQFEQYVLTGMVQPRRGLTPYARVGNLPVVGWVLLIMGWAAFRARAASRLETPPSHRPFP